MLQTGNLSLKVGVITGVTREFHWLHGLEHCQLQQGWVKRTCWGIEKKKPSDFRLSGVFTFFIGSSFDMRFDLLSLRGPLNGVKSGASGLSSHFAAQ